MATLAHAHDHHTSLHVQHRVHSLDKPRADTAHQLGHGLRFDTQGLAPQGQRSFARIVCER